MNRILSACALASLALSACIIEPPIEELPPKLSSFRVQVLGVHQVGSTTTPATVVKACTDAYPDGVPAELRGTSACPYAVAKSDVDFRVELWALDQKGEPFPYTGPVSFRVIPGDLSADYRVRGATMTDGHAVATTRANHVFGKATVWVEHAPPQEILDAATGTVVTAGMPTPPEGGYNFSRGISAEIVFDEPTLATLNEPDLEVFDNRDYGAPFTGQFVTIGKAPVAGAQLLHNCPSDPTHHGKPVTMVVTGIDAAGFFLTDINSCRIPERVSFDDPVAPILEADGFFPGTFGSIYVYNYSHPDGLDLGDALFSVSGSVQEFTSTTQLTFAAWNIAEKVRLLPADQWNKWLDQVPVHPFTLRTCGIGNTPYITDTLCANSRRNLKVESLESTLVKIENVKLPTVYAPCDKNADGEVQFFCDYRDDNTGERAWGVCPFGPAPAGSEVACYIDCTNTLGAYAREVCSERTTFVGYGQLSVELAGPGPAAAGLDDTVPGRVGEQVTAVGAVSARTTSTFATNDQVRIFCDADVRYAAGGAAVVATGTSTLLAANTLAEPYLDPGQTKLAFIAADGVSTARCRVAKNPHTKVLTVLKDVAPDLKLECNPNDADADAALQCQSLRAARYDITGHLRQVQPARPRWMVIPRDLDDVCCHPGPGLQCPTPIQACTP